MNLKRGLTTLSFLVAIIVTTFAFLFVISAILSKVSFKGSTYSNIANVQQNLQEMEKGKKPLFISNFFFGENRVFLIFSKGVEELKITGAEGFLQKKLGPRWLPKEGYDPIKKIIFKRPVICDDKTACICECELHNPILTEKNKAVANVLYSCKAPSCITSSLKFQDGSESYIPTKVRFGPKKEYKTYFPEITTEGGKVFFKFTDIVLSWMNLYTSTKIIFYDPLIEDDSLTMFFVKDKKTSLVDVCIEYDSEKNECVTKGNFNEFD